MISLWRAYLERHEQRRLARAEAAEQKRAAEAETVVATQGISYDLR